MHLHPLGVGHLGGLRLRRHLDEVLPQGVGHRGDPFPEMVQMDCCPGVKPGVEFPFLALRQKDCFLGVGFRVPQELRAPKKLGLALALKELPPLEPQPLELRQTVPEKTVPNKTVPGPRQQGLGPLGQPLQELQERRLIHRFFQLFLPQASLGLLLLVLR